KNWAMSQPFLVTEWKPLRAAEKDSTVSESTINGAFASSGKKATPMMSKSWITTEGAPMRKMRDPIHPGEILREEFMKPLGLSMNKLAMELRVPVTRIA